MNFGGGGYQSIGSYRGEERNMGGFMVNQDGGGGGGYAAYPGASQSPGGDGRKNVPKNQSIRPVTSAMIQAATGEDIFIIDGEDVGQIQLVGEIVELKEMATNCTYRIDDRTGPILDVKRWIDDEESLLEKERRAACREGTYVKIIGHLRRFNKQRSVVAFHIKPIEDFNEVTHHLTEIIYAHLAITKGLPLPKGFSEAQVQGEAPTPGGGWNPSATSTQVGSYGYGMGQSSTQGSYGYGMGSGLDPVQKQVLSVIGQSRSEQGIHINEVVSVVKNHGFSDQNIKNAIDFLSNEGHIYSTIDDEHYKSTDDL